MRIPPVQVRQNKGQTGSQKTKEPKRIIIDKIYQKAENG